MNGAAANDRGRSYDRPVYPSLARTAGRAISEGRGHPYRGERRAYDYDAPPPHRYAPPARAAAATCPASRSAGAGSRRYRLRPPPRGYTWVRMPTATRWSAEDGRVFDVVPY